MKESKLFFLGALDSAIEGKPESLAEYLCSEKPLDSADRKLLASFVKGDLDRKRGKPRKSLSAAERMWNEMRPLEAAVRDFDRILVVWRKRYNRKYRVRDAAIRLAVKRHPDPDVDFDKLNNRLRRAGRKPRRKRTK
jgi:hypothetical protein